MFVVPPAPAALPRAPLAPPKFNPFNLSTPRPRKKSRGVKPSAEDAIRRDPRVITLFNELSRGNSIVATTVAWGTVRAEGAGAGAAAGRASASPGSARRVSTGGATPPRGGSAPPPRSAGVTPRRPGSSSPAAPSPTAPSPAAPSPAASEPSAVVELTEEEAAAYLPTLPARAAAVAGFEPRSLQVVSDFVADMRAQGGDAPHAGHAAAAFPAARWRCMTEAAGVFDQLLDMCDTLTKWECRPQVGRG